MTISPEAKSTMKIFTTFQRLSLVSKEEEFSMFYVWMNKVEIYADRFKFS